MTIQYLSQFIMVHGYGNFIYDYNRSVKLWELRTTALKDMTYPRFPSQKEETHEHIAPPPPPTKSFADNRCRSHGGRPELKSLSVSLFVRAVNIQIILVYISIESPFFKLFKKKIIHYHGFRYFGSAYENVYACIKNFTYS